ncbi:MAG: InlB B-repeat-containing protein [Adhaeribacter sp.]
MKTICHWPGLLGLLVQAICLGMPAEVMASVRPGASRSPLTASPPAAGKALLYRPALRPVAGEQVLSFTLINASTELPILTLTPGQVLNLADLPSRSLNIRANTSPAIVGSVRFVLSGALSRTHIESGSPYALYGDNSGNYNSWTPALGTYTLTATPYPSANAGGTPGAPLSLSFSVIDQVTPPTQYTLSVTTPVNGTVTRNPSQASYASGTSVSLTAIPAAGYAFSAWGGDASGTANPTTLVMNANKTVSATFVVSSLSYTLSVQTTGSGTVTKNPDQASYSSGSTVTLTAAPAAGYNFTGWSGSASGTANPLAVVMNQNKTITANFSQPPAGQQVLSFSLINASDEQVIQTISPGEVFNLAALPSRSVNIQANTSPATVGSVRLVLSGTVNKTQLESGAPYTLYGDNGGNYNGWQMPVGNYTLTATPYTGSGGGGTAGTPLTRSFSVVDNGQALLLTRGPYLQMGNQTGITLRWRTNTASDSRVALGTAPGSYPLVVSEPALTTEHEVHVHGLSAATRYYYQVGSTTQVLQGGTDNFFSTAPPAGNPNKVRVAVLGDCGRNLNNVQSRTLTAYRNFVGANPAELLLLLGDNAYQSGTDAEYQSGFFSPYGSTILKNHVLYPAPGNHDYYSTSQSSRSGAYYNVFTMPRAGESGGVASGTEAYYSYDWGDIHFISLDSYGTESPGATRLYDTLGAQVTWVKQDLAANTKPWVVVYWHHPPYTMGSHNSNTEAELVEIRENFIRILERNGVDLVLTGHSHNYERSYLLRSHFGNESSFSLSLHAVTSSSGKYNGSGNSCPYTTVNGKARHGTVYLVSGSAGAVGGTQSGWPHNAMPFSDNGGGMVYLEIEQNRLDAKYLRADGVVWDQFTILKEVNKTSNLTLPANTPTQLTASWLGDYQWSTGEVSRSITVSPGANTSYQVRDSRGCLTDHFQVTVVPAARTAGLSPIKPGPPAYPLAGPELYPTLVSRGGQVFVRVREKGAWQVEVRNVNGQVVSRTGFQDFASLATSSWLPGMYVVRLQGPRAMVVRKIFVRE